MAWALRWLAGGLLVGLSLGAAAGLVLSRGIKLPAVEALTSYRPAAATQVRAKEGSLLATFANERRIPLPGDRIPDSFRDAVIAAEDASFYRHTGIDPKGVLRAVIRNVSSRRFAEGGSTITMQLARSIFLTTKKTWGRKLEEALLAIEIEQRFSKDQIFTLYANQVLFGHGIYGVEAASRFFFGKTASRLTLPEAALLAGIVQVPERLSPLRHPERALARRNYVLDRMLQEGMIDETTCLGAKQVPLEVEAHYDRQVTAAYFIEEVRREIEDRFGTREMLEGGLTVETTVDPRLQRYAEDAVKEGLVELQRRLGWPGARRNVLPTDGGGLDHWRDPSWRFLAWREGELVYALVKDVRAEQAELVIGDRPALLDVEDAGWTNRTSLVRLFRRGDVLLVRLLEIPTNAATPVLVGLEGEPSTESALIALDNRTGAILALVGGFDFNRSQFDRAIQARRQCGSAFKPFVYMAAFEQGYAPTDLILDGPILLPDERGDLTYCPLNYYRRFDGIVTLRSAVERSLNVAAVKVQQMVGGEAVIDVARRLGITETLAPYPSMALGSFELTLLELAASYAAIANRGQFAEPYFISRVRSADGETLAETRPTLRHAVGADVAFMMTHVLEGVVQRGTGIAARDLPGHLAGKTGTTDRYTDAWFIGYSPRITCAVWVGRDLKERIGRNMTGAEAALPTWKRFMGDYLATLSEDAQQDEFPVPPGVALVAVDRRTGLRALPDCAEHVILDSIPDGRPQSDCSHLWHQFLDLPWPQQLPYYTYRPGEPQTTLETIEAAEKKLAEKDQ